ncbi:MAG: peptide ABC transporter substrate-binding protein [Streptosporangiales bacterium]
MDFRARTLATALVALPCLALAACSGGGQTSTSNKDQAAIALTAGEAPNYMLPSDPNCTATNNHNLRRLMYKPLYWYGGVPDDEFALNKGLSIAEPPKYNANGTQVTITLKDYKWSDGEPVTAKDIAFFLDLYSASKKEWGCYSVGNVPDNIKKKTVKNDKTIVLTLDQQYAPKWFTVNALAGITPLPQHVWDKTSASAKIGDHPQTKAGYKQVFDFLTEQAKSLSEYDSNPLWEVVDGPWTLKKFDPRGDITFVPNKKYSGPDKSKLDKLVEKRFTTDQAEFDALLSSDEITTGYIPSQNAKRKEQVTDKGYTVYRQGNFGLGYVSINFNSNNNASLFRQLYVRQALQHLINEPQYVKKAYNGNAAEVHGPVPIKPENPYASDFEKSVPYPYDPQKSVQLLKEHGWTVKPDGISVCTSPGTGAHQCGKGIPKGKKFEWTLVYSKGVESDRAMQAFQSAATKAGIKINLHKATFDQAVSVAEQCKHGSDKCNWDAVNWGGWHFGAYPTGENLFYRASGSGSFQDDKADRLINLTKTKGGEAAMTKYQNYVAKILPVLWLPRAQGGLNVVRSDLKGFDRDKQSLFGDSYPQYWHFSK